MRKDDTSITGNRAAGKHEHPLPQEISDKERRQAIEAHKEAEKDMEADAELTAGDPTDDLDEGEIAKLGEETKG